MTKTSYTLIHDPIPIADGGLKPGFRVYGLELYYMLQYYCITEGAKFKNGSSTYRVELREVDWQRTKVHKLLLVSERNNSVVKLRHS